jgi:hypothetical protein
MAFLLGIIAGDHLISHTVTRAVPSAQRGLTSVFGMGTGDPSQYGHRQILAFQSVSLEPKSCAHLFFGAKNTTAFDLEGAWRVVARSLPQRLLGFRMVSPGLSRNAVAIWRQTNTTKLIGITRLVRRASANCAELILWTSRTGD